MVTTSANASREWVPYWGGSDAETAGSKGCVYVSVCLLLWLGPVFGSRDYFSGLGVFLDTYANQDQQNRVSWFNNVIIVIVMWFQRLAVMYVEKWQY